MSNTIASKMPEDILKVYYKFQKSDDYQDFLHDGMLIHVKHWCAMNDRMDCYDDMMTIVLNTTHYV